MSAYLDEIEACVPALRRYARALTHDVDRADDLVQDCLERAVRKRLLWRPTGSLRAWLFTMLLNIHRNEMRRVKRERRHFSPELPLVEPAAPASQLSRLALAETARAMERLAPEQREALLLVVLEGMSYADAAAALGIPTGTLMSRLARARAALKNFVEGETPRLRSIK